MTSLQLEEDDVLIDNSFFNDVYLPLLATDTRYNVAYGGGGSGKSDFLAARLFIKCLQTRGRKYAVIRKVADTIRKSVYQQFKDVAKRWNIEDEVRFFDGRFEIHINGNEIWFFGVSDPEKLKSLAEMQEIWVEEATELSKEEFNQIDIRLRGESDERKKIFLSFNPINKEHWLVKRFFTGNPDDTTTLKTTYLDNRFVGSDYAAVLNRMREIDPLYYEVYALGNWGIIRPENPFFSKFNYAKHVSKELEFNRNEPVYLSFDFNSKRETCLISQKTPMRSNHYLKEFHEPGLDLYGLCATVKAMFPAPYYFITGDPSGNGGSAFSAGNISGYQIIRQCIPEGDFSRVLTAPVSYVNSRLITNGLLTFSPDLRISEQGCPTLISDIQRTKTSSDGGLDKHDCNKHDYGHVADAFRYDHVAFHYDEFQMLGLNHKAVA
jgi:phage terminase large subunit